MVGVAFAFLFFFVLLESTLLPPVVGVPGLLLDFGAEEFPSASPFSEVDAAEAAIRCLILVEVG